jgi:hypothetical protein
MENIYQQAIADAKALRASAMANAKSALQEAFEPKITEMVRLKLSEELEEVEELEEMEDLEEMQDYEQGLEEVDETIDESGLDEILAELEELANEGEHDGLNEAEEDEDAEEDDEEAMDDEDSEVEDAEEDIVDDETKVIDITLGDLKKVFQSLQAQEETPEMDDTDLEAAEEEDMEEPFSLDEILAELENEGKDHMYEKKDKEVKDDEEKHKMKEELNEAKKAIKQLQESFTEVNLLNAKLLYMNKLFKAKNLSESEKIRVVKAFDRASSVKEVKNTFDVLKESIETKKKSQIQESFGYASKPAGVSPSNNVIESDPFVSRWQKIAGL